MEKGKNQSDKYLFDIKDFEIVRNINSGGFGTVNLVRNKINRKEYAAKTNLIPNRTQNKLFISREVRILIQIQHPTIIQFRGFSYFDFAGNKNITILMDYMKEGSLAELIDKEQKGLSPGHYDNTKRQIILAGVARGMMVLHSHHIIQRDLKPENILLDSELHPCITDFGLSKIFDPYHSMNQSTSDTGTAAYMAPEVISSDKYNTKADVYSFGILMYEVLLGKRAYDSLMHGKKKLTMFQLKTKVCQGLRPEIKTGEIKQSFQKLIEKCWSANPNDRPTFSELFKKLSLTRDDFFINLNENFEKPNVLDDDDDDEEGEEDELAMALNKKYCLDEVDFDEFLNYVDEISQDPTSAKKQRDEEMASEIESMRKQIESMSVTVKKQEEEIKSLKNQLVEAKSEMADVGGDALNATVKAQLMMMFPTFISATPSLDGPGILEQLRRRETSKFRHRLVIASVSTMDIYNLIDPNTQDYFGTSNLGDSFIEFELERPITMSKLDVYSANRYFPQSFDVEVDDRIVASIKGTKKLNGPNRVMNVIFKPCRGQKIRIKQTGPNLDEGDNFLIFKRFEIQSPDPEFASGVFATLINASESRDPHKCPVFISASRFDFNAFTSLDAPYNICVPDENSWFQVELPYGFAFLTGCRIKRGDQNRLRSFRIICSDNCQKPLISWTTLLDVSEKTKDEHKLLDTYMFQSRSPPAKFVRIILTGPHWDNEWFLIFFHFDLFGTYM